jgi:hypothetical protein
MRTADILNRGAFTGRLIAVADEERVALPSLPLVFVARDSAFGRRQRRDAWKVAAILAVAILGALGIWLSHRAGIIDAEDFGRWVLGPFYERFLGKVWFGLAALVVLAVAWAAKELSGGDDYGLEIHRDGVVWMRRQDQRYKVPWTNVGRIWRIPVVDVDGFELIEPIDVADGPGRWKKLDAIPFGHHEPEWRVGQIGAVLRRFAPHLLDVGAAVPAAAGSNGLAAEPGPAGWSDPVGGDEWREPRLPLVLRFRDSAFAREADEGSRLLNVMVAGIGALVVALVAGSFAGVLDPARAADLIAAIGGLPDFFRVAVWIVLGLVAVGILVVLWIWVTTTIGGLRAGDDWQLEFREDGFVFVSAEGERAIVPWADVRRIERVPLADYDEFVLARPFTVRARFGPPVRYGEVGFGMLDKHWRSGPIGAILRTHAPHLFAPALAPADAP